MTQYSIAAGNAAPLGATVSGDGVNFAVFSANASQMYLCLFDGEGIETRIPFNERTGDIWHCHIDGIGVGQAYGFRADGIYAPELGHRFNVNKFLLDPYARRLTGHPVWNDALFGFEVGHTEADLSFDNRDSAEFMPRCIVEDPAVPPATHPRTPFASSVIYEAHVRGLTCNHPDLRLKGNFESLTQDPILDHLTQLGVTAIELLPIHAFINDRFLIDKGLTNYWGYQSIGFFAPDPRYLSGSDIGEVRRMVDRFHDAGIEVILDVVYNHSGESDHLGPTLSFRGLDNASYYRLQDDARYYINDTGTGNTLRVEHPMVLCMILDSLRYWVQTMGVDGFRFDLCATLGRTETGFDANAAFFQAIRQDPVLAQVKLIAEPWDIGPGGYQLGSFPPPFAEWNDKFRDGVRRFWRGDGNEAAALAGSLLGSAQEFDRNGRPASSSVNLLTAHDGFTLRDVVSFAEKHNHANGEDGRDGHSENFSDNMGVEGDTDDPVIQLRRAARQRAMLTTLLVSQGVPMILAGDEIGHSQAGNNNAYNQDNETAWIDWSSAQEDLLAFVQKLIAFRKTHAVLRQTRFLHSETRMSDGKPDLRWWHEDGREMQPQDWEDPSRKLVIAELRQSAGTPEYQEAAVPVLLAFNAGAETQITLPDVPRDCIWHLELDSASPKQPTQNIDGSSVMIAAQAALAFTLQPVDRT